VPKAGKSHDFLQESACSGSLSAMTSPLSSFIAHARDKGMDHQTIRMLLLSAGWKEKDIASAMVSESLSMPVPLPRDSGSARDAFFHLLGFTALLSTVGSLIYLLFEYWNRLFPDAAFQDSYYYDTYSFSGIRWAIATLFISYPLYVWMSRLIHKEISMHPEKLISGVRRWLTYITLFFTACVLVGDAVTVVFYLLQGEITLRFLLKALTLFVLCGSVFHYYFSVLRMNAEEYAKSTMHKAFLVFSGVVVVAVIIWGFFIAGSPMFGRQQRLDEQRVQDLRNIQNEVYNIAWGNGDRWTTPKPTKLPNALPKTLEEVAANATYMQVNIMDPETAVPYDYRTLTASTFELCATFDTTRDQKYDIFWNHSTGKACFQFDAMDPNMK
jgi:hypothetical protein